MAKVDELEVLIKANTSELKAGLAKTESQLSSFGKGISAKAVAIGGVISAAFTRAFQAVSNEMKEAVTRLDAINNYPKVMSNLGIESGIASQSINKLSEQLRGLPTNLSDAVLATQRFASVNSNLAYSTDAFLALNNAILAGGASAQIQSSALEQLSQAYAKGKPDMMEWRTAMMAMPAQLKQVAIAMGLPDSSALGEGLRDGTISMNDFMNTVMKLNTQGVSGFKSFSEQAKNSTGGVATSVVNMKIAIQRAMADIMNVIGQANIAGFFNTIANVIGKVGAYIGAFIKLIKQAIAWVQALFGGGSGSTANMVRETSSGFDGMASSIGDTGSAMDDATGSAKKLKHALAGFDEMNVLQEQQTGGSGSDSGGSSGGSGGVNVGDYEWDTSPLTGGVDKVEEAFEKLKNFLNGIFGDIDFDKLGKAFKQFYNDVKKALTPLKKLLKDVWDNYLKPFITWTGNELLPAFLNALGGAIDLLGQVIGAVWSNFLKPFIDDFLVPIAQFTGGVIVGVLNGIGDACRAIASSETGVNAIVAALVTIGTLLAAYKFAVLQEQIHNLTIVAMELGTEGNIAIGGIIAKLVALNAAAIESGGVFAGVKTIFTQGISSVGSTLSGFVETICSPAGIAIELVGLAITGVVTAVELVKTAIIGYQSTHKQYISGEELAEELANRREAAVQREKEALERLKDATMNVNTANYDLVSAEKNLRDSTAALSEKAKENNTTTEDAIKWYEDLHGNLSSLDDKELELAETVARYKTARDRSTTANKQYTDAVNEMNSANDEMIAEQNEQIRTLLAEQAQIYATKNDWNGLSNMLNQLVQDEQKFQLENGETVKRSKDDMAWLTMGVANDVAKSYKDWDKIWNQFPSSTRNSANSIRAQLGLLQNQLSILGSNTANDYAQGLINQLRNRNSDLYNAGWQATNTLNKGGKAGINSNSPSKKAMELGQFYDEGLILGLKSKEKDVESASYDLTSGILDSMQAVKDFELNDIDFSTKLTPNFGDLVDSETEIEARETPVHVTVNVGEETLLNKVISGINDLSNLENKNVLYV